MWASVPTIHEHVGIRAKHASACGHVCKACISMWSALAKHASAWGASIQHMHQHVSFFYKARISMREFLAKHASACGQVYKSYMSMRVACEACMACGQVYKTCISVWSCLVKHALARGQACNTCIGMWACLQNMH